MTVTDDSPAKTVKVCIVVICYFIMCVVGSGVSLFQVHSLSYYW